MTFSEKYHSCKTWHERAIIMEIFHLAMCHNDKNWTITRTAQQFGVSIGLVSENLRLANALHKNEKLITCETRQEALKKLNGYR